MSDVRRHRADAVAALEKLAFHGGSHGNLSAICEALYGVRPEFGWTLGACYELKEYLTWLLSDSEPVSEPISDECEQVSETDDTEPNAGLEGITAQLRSRGTGTYDNIVFNEAEFGDLCNGIDAVHRRLEQEYERLTDALDTEWVKLPADMDGIPCRSGDMLYDSEGGSVVVRAIIDPWNFIDGSGASRVSSMYSHDVQNDSAERIIEDYDRAIYNYNRGYTYDAEYKEDRRLIIDRIRKLGGAKC